MRGRLVASLCCMCWIGCAGGMPEPSTAVSAAALDDTRWTWLELQCSDGAAPLAARGFGRELRIDVGDRGLRFVEDTRLDEVGCTRSELSVATVEAGRWNVSLRGELSWPPEQPCGPQRPGQQAAALGLSGDVLEVLYFASPWCGGYDARFTYRRATPEPLTEAQLVTQYFLLFSARDFARLSGLFATHASLVEPFTKTADGVLARHEGRAAVQGWFERAFAAAPRLAIRVTEMRSDEPGQHVVSWEYMDDSLAEPLRGRNLFVIAAGEIFEAQIQLLDAPKPRQVAAPDSAGSAPQAAPHSSAGATP